MKIIENFVKNCYKNKFQKKKIKIIKNFVTIVKIIIKIN